MLPFMKCDLRFESKIWWFFKKAEELYYQKLSLICFELFSFFTNFIVQ